MNRTNPPTASPRAASGTRSISGADALAGPAVPAAPGAARSTAAGRAGSPSSRPGGAPFWAIEDRGTLDLHERGHLHTRCARDLDRVRADRQLRGDGGADREMSLAVGDARSERNPRVPRDQVDLNGVVCRDAVAADDQHPTRTDDIGFDEDAGDAIVSGRGRRQRSREQGENGGREQAAPRGHQPRGAGPIVNPGYRGLGRQGDATLDGQFGAVAVSASWQVMRPFAPPRTFGVIGVFAVM